MSIVLIFSFCMICFSAQCRCWLIDLYLLNSFLLDLMTEPMSPPGKIVIKETVQASAKGRNVEADALTLKINQTITQTRSNQYSKMTDWSNSERTTGCCKGHEGRWSLPFSSISIVQIITSHQYAMISITPVIVWPILSSPLLTKIAKYLLLSVKLSGLCTILNLVHQASIRYRGGFITTALMRLTMWFHTFWICGTIGLPLHCGQAVITPVSKVAKSSILSEYRPISVTPISRIIRHFKVDHTDYPCP